MLFDAYYAEIIEVIRDYSMHFKCAYRSYRYVLSCFAKVYTWFMMMLWLMY